MKYGYTKWDAFNIQHLPSKESIVTDFFGSKSTRSIEGSYLTTIEDSIYYNALTSRNFDIYELFVGSTAQNEHSKKAFIKLIEDFDITKFGIINVGGYIQSKRFFVEDGNHRLAILKYSNLFPKGIPNKFMKITFGDKCLEEIGSALKVTTSGRLYNGWHNNRAPYGYHSFNLYNMNFIGQRNPAKRLEKIRKFVDFTDKKVLDLGCNSGGMLLHMPEISDGCGIDLDSNCLLAAELISSRMNYANNLTFLKQNLNEFDICEFVKTQFHPDYIFLLSLGSWVSNWRKLYTDCFDKASAIILETNNDTEGAHQLSLFESLGGKITLMSDKSDDDVTGNLLRKTYLVTKI